MKVVTITTIVLPDREIPPGQIISIPDHFLQRLAGKVEPISHQAWLANGELRTRGSISDLTAEICRLTENDLPMQKTLLQRHVESYDRHHFWKLAELWEERSAIVQYDGGLSREEAELEVARCLHLLAFLDELRSKEAQAA